MEVTGGRRKLHTETIIMEVTGGRRKLYAEKLHNLYVLFIR
jgi:hypothetical protein